MSKEREIWLVHPEQEMIDAFRERFRGLPNVVFHTGRFEDLPPHDCFVTAGNSFGMMTAGIDAAVVHHLGRPVIIAVQRHIVAHYRGEQPVGTAFVVETGNARVPFLVHAPTMRVPTSIDGTTNIYVATWAALLEIARYNEAAENPIRTVAFPAFGTGFGMVTFTEAARQMAAAYRHFLEPPSMLDWDFVIARNKSVCYDAGKQVAR